MKPDKPNLLFVCSRNRWRSPTAEKIYARDNRINVRSRGTTRSAVQKVTAQDIAWAHVILAMEDEHRKRLLGDFPDRTRPASVRVLDIPDDYHFMDPELVDLIVAAVEPIIEQLSRSKRAPR